MDWKMNFSWLFLVGGGLWGADMARTGEIQGHPVPAALGGAYFIWALYWGAPSFWRGWRRYWPRLTGFLGSSFHAWLVRLCVGIPLALLGGVYFSVFGGGPYQFLKHWRTVRSA